MKLMTYNILNGGEKRLPFIVQTIRSMSPDYVTINEANTFARNDHKILKEVAQEIQLPYCEIALSGEYDYHVAVFSKYPFVSVHKIQPLMRACIVTTVKAEVGLLSIASLHLTPYSEDLRHPEIDHILSFQKKQKNRVLMGDMNSLSPEDEYDPIMVKRFNAMQLKKFTTDGMLRFDAIKKIMSSGYVDSAVYMKKNNECTAPTSINEYNAHTNMRLDYVFLSKSLLPYFKKYQVIKTPTTEKASDHYPITVELFKQYS